MRSIWYGSSAAVWALTGLMVAIAVAAGLSPAIRHAPPLPD